MSVSTDYMALSSEQNLNSAVDYKVGSPKGYAYNDEYGFAHVLDDYQTALKYSGDGKIYAFEGRYGGGYALDQQGDRASLPLPGTIAYGNDVKNGITPTRSDGTFTLLDQMMASYRTAYSLRIPEVDLLAKATEAAVSKKEFLISSYL